MNQETRCGPSRAIGTEPRISHLASVKLGEPSRACTTAATGLVDGRRGEVRGDHGRRVAHAEEDQRRGHQCAATHAGQPDHYPDEETGGEDREEGGGEDLGHGDLSEGSCGQAA